ncbi:MAG TPA: amidohydrolase family protein [Candidatus Tectomicrobia bacterium]|nr:amidohydrolase family protein [Candidatus Tectomicrobia bacterium]
MHAHYVPPKVLSILERDASPYDAELREAAGGGQCVHFTHGLTIRPFFPELLDLEERWQDMEQQGVDRQILSVWTDLSGYGMPPEAGARWHRLLNEIICDEAHQHTQRLSALASVPLQDAQRAARELEYGVRQCGAVGGVIAANVDGVNLGEAPLDEFWATAVQLDVPLFIHPTQPTPLPRTRHYGLNQIVQYTYDTTASIGSLIFSGVLDRFPDLKLILSHGGGYFPYQAGRFDRVYRDLEPSKAPSQAPSAYLRRFFYDTILHHPMALRYLRDLVGSERLLLGTDYPFPMDDRTALKRLEQAGCTADEIAAIGGGNAQSLFKL